MNPSTALEIVYNLYFIPDSFRKVHYTPSNWYNYLSHNVVMPSETTVWRTK